jgi:integrase
VTWDEAVEMLKAKWPASGLRATSLAAYLKDVSLIRTHFPDTAGPADITPARAEAWLDAYTTGTDRRIRNTGRERRQHSPHNVKARLGALSAVWGKWFLKKLKIVEANPFADLTPPKADRKEVRYVDDAQLAEFFAYLDDYYLGWDFPRLFFSLKAYTGCRLADICGLRADSLRDGGIVFPAGLVKGRKQRTVPLPKDLYDALGRYAGRKYLWEKYPAQLRAILTKKGVPVHQLDGEFAPSRLYPWVQLVMVRYNALGPKSGPITTHQFRKRAFTLAWEGHVRPHEAAIAFGCNVDTLMKHYVKLDEDATTASVLARIGGNILGQPGGGTLFAENSPRDAQGKAGVRMNVRARYAGAISTYRYFPGVLRY